MKIPLTLLFLVARMVENLIATDYIWYHKVKHSRAIIDKDLKDRKDFRGHVANARYCVFGGM